MLKKRLVGVITVKNGWAVQSFGYRKYLPLGRPEFLAENFDRWGADEILLQVIDRSKNCLGPDFKLLERIGALGLRTPLIYSGGIRSKSDGIKLIQLGADRIMVDAMLHEDYLSIEQLSTTLGAQALIASIPLSSFRGSLLWYDYRTCLSKPMTVELVEFIQSRTVSEVMITDWKHEGKAGEFEQIIIELFPIKDISIIAFGGISKVEQIKKLLQSSDIMAVGVGNFLSYREHAIQNYKTELTGQAIRLAAYESKNSLISNVCYSIL